LNLYLDHAASTPLSEGVKSVIRDSLELYGNPSSLHKLGVATEKHIKESRRLICEALNINERELVFTSGGTEANNLAILGSVVNKSRGRYITSKIEHPSVLNTFQALSKSGNEVMFLSVDSNGIVDIDELSNSLNDETVLVSIMFVNNETGAIQPIEKIGKLIYQYNKDHKTNIRFHVDAVQAFGKFPINVDACHITLMSISAHKINGIKGIGALYVNNSAQLKPILHGGQQEYMLRPGTENIIGILSFAKATKDAYERMISNFQYVTLVKETLAARLLGSDENNFREQENDTVFINGKLDADFSPYILNVSFLGVKAEVLLHSLEMKQIYVATGSACSSKKKEYSHVLIANHLGEDRIESAIRLSFGPDLDIENMKFAADEILKTANDLRLIMNKSDRFRKLNKNKKRI